MYIYLMKYRPIIIIVLNYHLTWSSNHVSCNVLTARSIKAWSPVMNSHSVMPKLTNQKLRKVSSWLLIGLNLHERMWINQKPSHFCTPCCNVCSWTKGLMILALLGYSRKNPHPPDGWGPFLTPPLTWISWSTRPPLPTGFPRWKTPPSAWISGKK